jgi:hypothetical protein
VPPHTCVCVCARVRVCVPTRSLSLVVSGRTITHLSIVQSLLFLLFDAASACAQMSLLSLSVVVAAAVAEQRQQWWWWVHFLSSSWLATAYVHLGSVPAQVTLCRDGVMRIESTKTKLEMADEQVLKWRRH